MSKLASLKETLFLRSMEMDLGVGSTYRIITAALLQSVVRTALNEVTHLVWNIYEFFLPIFSAIIILSG
jgi:hypothetical protein